jgi:hypothetical protein
LLALLAPLLAPEPGLQPRGGGGLLLKCCRLASPGRLLGPPSPCSPALPPARRAVLPPPSPQTGKHTRWQLLGRAPALAHEFATAYSPRRALQLGALGQLALQQDFDFTGLVLHVAPQLQADRGSASQWVFLADETVAGGGAAGGGGEQGQAAAAGQQQQQPFLLAVRLQGQPECVDFLEPGRALGSVLSLRNLVLERRDEANRLWAAVAGDTAALATVAAAGRQGAGRRQVAQEGLLGWARVSGALVQQLQLRIQGLVGA